MNTHSDIEQLWRDYFSEIYRFVRRRTTSVAAAEDITVDVFVAATRAAKKDRSAELGVGFLYTVAKRRLIDSWRAEERKSQFLERFVSSNVTNFTIDADLLDGRHDLSWMAAVPGRQRTALFLRYACDLSLAQTADRMEMSRQGTESLLARGRRSARAAVAASTAS